MDSFVQVFDCQAKLGEHLIGEFLAVDNNPFSESSLSALCSPFGVKAPFLSLLLHEFHWVSGSGSLVLNLAVMCG